jgi:hypothetical protein
VHLERVFLEATHIKFVAKNKPKFILSVAA